VYAGSFDASMAMNSGGLGSISPSQLAEQVKEAMAAGVGPGIVDMLEKQGTMTAEQISMMRTQMEKFASMTPEQIAEEMKTALSAMSNADGGIPALEASGGIPTRGVLIAIQDPRGAYLLGWGALQAGEQWRFTNAPAAAGDRSRASAWDGVGPLGFVYTSVASGSFMDTLPEGVEGLDTDAGSDASPSDEPGGPTRKNTPAGPVTIPGG